MLDNNPVSTFPRQRVHVVTDEMFEIVFDSHQGIKRHVIDF
jgi:hypothetical protein